MGKYENFRYGIHDESIAYAIFDIFHTDAELSKYKQDLDSFKESPSAKTKAIEVVDESSGQLSKSFWARVVLVIVNKGNIDRRSLTKYAGICYFKFKKAQQYKKIKEFYEKLVQHYTEHQNSSNTPPPEFDREDSFAGIGNIEVTH
ncbi:hypothetical protein QAD02_012595 [Eretmocerus hayati]|uniref:Uncharacterized protein n=1 Tax=Eretmocerus hayati TaxID=131215 RepID=A0ACC2P038_9HYME|nr:hypothetical protein QAD02_012595 [Eretmocerus hayati]